MPRSLNASAANAEPGVRDERDRAVSQMVGRREPGRAQLDALVAGTPCRCRRTSGCPPRARSRRAALGKRRGAGLGRLVLVQRRERDERPRSGATASRAACSIRWFADAEDREVGRAGHRRRSTGSRSGRAPRRSRGSPGRCRPRSRRAGSPRSSARPSEPSLTAGAHDRHGSRLEHRLEARSSRASRRRRPSPPTSSAMALSFLAALYACQPGMPFTPPPPCVAHEPWYRPLIGVRKSAYPGAGRMWKS